VKIVFIAILVMLVLVIVIQNRESVETRLLFFTLTMPRAALLFVTTAIGFAGGVLTTWLIVSRSAIAREVNGK